MEPDGVVSGQPVLRPGESFEVRRDQPHAERYGAQGATCWVARRAD